MVAVFLLRSILTAAKVGPKFLRFAQPKIFFRNLTLKGDLGVAPLVLSRTATSFLTGGTIGIGLKITGKEDFVANRIIGQTISPVSQGKITTVQEGGAFQLDVIKSFSPFTPRPSFSDIRILAAIHGTPIASAAITFETARQAVIGTPIEAPATIVIDVLDLVTTLF